MKKMIFLLLTAISLSAAVYAQPGGFQRQTAEERVARLHQKLDSAFKLDPALMAKVDTALLVLYKSRMPGCRRSFPAAKGLTGRP